MGNLSKTWSIAEQTSVHALTDACLNCIHDNLSDMLASPLLNGLQMPAFFNILRIPADIRGREEHKFLALTGWIEVDETGNRCEHLSDGLSIILKNKLSFDFIIAQMEERSPVRNQEMTRKWLTDAMKLKKIDISSTKPSSPQHSKAAFVIGQGATLKYDQFGIVRWSPETGDEFLIGCFPFRPNAYLATLEDKLFLVGGDEEGKPVTRVNSFRVSDGDQQEVAPMSVARTRIGIASSPKEILVCGGWDGSTVLSSCELYRSTENRWITMPSLGVARRSLRIVWLPDGRVFTIGGFNGKNTYFKCVEMVTRGWNTEGVSESAWRNVAGMYYARCGFAAVVLHDLILVAGGETTGKVNISNVELFTPPSTDDQLALGQWTGIQPMPSPMFCFSGVVIGEAVFILDPNSSKMQHFRPSLSNAEWSTTAGFAEWVWDEEASLKLIKNRYHATVFK